MSLGMTPLVFDIFQLSNLRSLHDHEEKLRDDSLKVLAADAAHSEMLFLIANAMGILFGFSLDHKAQEDDDVTLQYFGIRLFNNAGSSIKLALSGYTQQALSLTRDIMEVAFLLDYFRSSPDQISVWKAADAKARKSKFGPLQIRVALDARDGNKERKREKAYAVLSENASHATYGGFRLTMKNGDGQFGPFVDEPKLKAWLGELSLRLLPAAHIYGAHFLDAPTDVLRLYVAYRTQVLEWWQWNKTDEFGPEPT